MDSYWGNIFHRDEAQQEMHVLLKQIPLFTSLDRRELAAIERLLYRREYAVGEDVFRQGAPGAGMYIVERGSVEIIYQPAGQVLAQLGEGEFFGEIALLNETPRSATARARTPATLLCIFRPDLLSLVERSPRLGVKVLLSLAQIAGHRLVALSDDVQALRDELAALHGGRPEAAWAPAPAGPAPPSQTDRPGGLDNGAPEDSLD